MRICIASDKTGKELKDRLKLCLLYRDGIALDNAGLQAIDDWPGIAYYLATLVSLGQCERGILICGTGMGMAMMANKVEGAYAAVCHTEADAVELASRRGGNILVLGCNHTPWFEAVDIAMAFINAPSGCSGNGLRMKELESL